MALFSWFIRRTNVSSIKNTQASLEQELLTFNNNTMWPIAKVRGNVLIQQQKYVKSASHLKNEIKFNSLQKIKINLLKEHVS
ncbi:hypothetical protein H4J38_11860 [Colwellia sp. BRX10-3]|uniref:hypothetical protein n=1 Tax=Colwellia sp. BRX10-3 TaxID=2759844 RepID=UPI0015F49671|nr:hypothetical protein [Colwellia sp. BRX10-3]MBA6391469.1 hypothetical protein [Colwellia sp. BRX10-3]